MLHPHQKTSNMSDMFSQVMNNRITKPMNMRKGNTAAGFYGSFGYVEDMTKRGEGLIVTSEGPDHNLRVAFKDKG